MDRKLNPEQEGHTREWADRARVELDPREDVKRPASPKQSPDADDEDVEEKSRRLADRDEAVY